MLTLQVFRFAEWDGNIQHEPGYFTGIFHGDISWNQQYDNWSHHTQEMLI